MANMTSTLREIASAFEWQPGRGADETWLTPGSSIVLESLELFADIRSEAYWAAALLLCVIEKGGSCLPLDQLPLTPEFSRLPAELQQISVSEWSAILMEAAGQREVRPLVVAHNALYFDRLYRLELDIAERLVRPLGADALPEPASWIGIVNELFGDDASSPQRQVAASLFTHRCSLLAGGPGSGKTYTVAKTILALYRATDNKASIKICAPTGKAAQRVREALLGVVRELDPTNAAAIADAIQPTTIHSLLGISPLSHRRRENEPLHLDFVICDETSMVDLMLLSELLRSLDTSTRLLLVGDPNQLQSVDVGSVMADLVSAMKHGLPGVTLTTTHRVGGDDMNATDRARLLSFFDAIKSEDVDLAIEQLSAGSTILHHVPIHTGFHYDGHDFSPVTRVLQRAEHLKSLASGDSNEDIAKALTDTMVLTAQHHGLLSRTWWVEHVAVSVDIPLRATPLHAGTPVLITTTDRSIGLTNGDVGLIVREADGSTMFHPFDKSVLDTDEVAPRHIRPAAITSWQPWWAMTIHKSQGSEFDHVIVSITPGTRLLSRELLYTAVTRAKKSVTVIGNLEDIREALKSPAKRYSGLANAIAQASQGS